MTDKTPYDNPPTLSDRIIFPALRDAYRAGFASGKASDNHEQSDKNWRSRITREELVAAYDGKGGEWVTPEVIDRILYLIGGRP